MNRTPRRQVEEGLCELVASEWLNHTSPKAQHDACARALFACSDISEAHAAQVAGKQDAVAAYLLHVMEHNPDPVYGGLCLSRAHVYMTCE